MQLLTKETKFKSNFKAQSKSFGIGDVSRIIEILRSKMYSKPIQTLVQEYLCNARDAMREINKDNIPIKVFLPSRLEPTLRIRDFGPGVSPERMENVFILYGASTKRDSNRQTGGFGIGAKSAWAYTDSFVIKTYIDGVQRNYIAHTGNDNNGQLDLVEEVSTTEPNGTEIQIAISPSDMEEFHNAVFRAVHFWDVKPEFVASVDIPEFNAKTFKIGQNIEISDFVSHINGWRYYAHSNISLAVDGILYILSDDIVSKVDELRLLGRMVNKNVVLHVPTGSVGLAASREYVEDIPQTIEFLKEFAKKERQNLSQYIQDRFTQCTNLIEFIKVYNELSPVLKVQGHQGYHDYSISQNALVHESFKELNISSVTNKKGRLIVHTNDKGQSFRHRLPSEIPLKAFNLTYFYDNSESKVMRNRRLKRFFEENPATTWIFLITGNSPEFDMVKTDLELKDIKTLPLPVVEKVPNAPRPRRPKSILVHLVDRTYAVELELSKVLDIYYWVPMEHGSFKLYSKFPLRDLENDLGIKICGLGKDAQKKVKGLSCFRPLSDLLKQFKPTVNMIAALKHSKACTDNLELLSELTNVKGIKDPVFEDMQKEYQNVSTKASFGTILYNIILKDAEVQRFIKKDQEFMKYWTSQYPILKNMDYSIKKEEYVYYINAKYNKKGARK